MKYQKRKRSVGVMAKVCEVLPSVIAVRKLEFAHLQKENNLELLLVEKIGNAYNRPGEVQAVKQSVPPALFEYYQTCVGSAQHILTKFKEISGQLSFPYETELEQLAYHFNNLQPPENYTPEYEEELERKSKTYHEHLEKIKHLEVHMISIGFELQIFKQEYDTYLEMLRQEKEKPR